MLATSKRCCRRPVGQAVRYGDWYTGNDTDLDEHLHEYNAEHADAASASGNVLLRRKSALSAYTADIDSSDFSETEGHGPIATVRPFRRSTVAPSQVGIKY